MAKHGKKYLEAAKLIEPDRRYEIAEATELLPRLSISKFDGTVEAHLRLGVDPRHADQLVRGTVVLPHGTGRTTRVIVFAQGEKAQEALRAGRPLVTTAVGGLPQLVGDGAVLIRPGDVDALDAAVCRLLDDPAAAEALGRAAAARGQRLPTEQDTAEQVVAVYAELLGQP